MTFSNKITSQNFHMAWHVILCSIAYIDAPNKGIEQTCSPGRVVIYISVHLVLIYTLTFTDVLLVFALNLIVHKSNYCKYSLAWCQARTFLLFTIWTHPLQMKEYPLQYASTDKNKKSHYNFRQVPPITVAKYCLHAALLRDGFKTQPLVDRRFRPVPSGFYCSKQWQPPGTGRNRRSTSGWVLKSPLSIYIDVDVDGHRS